MNSRQQPKLSERVERLQPSAIREILAVIDRPGMISFAGGLPSADSFPDLSGMDLPREALQYGPSEGEPALRAQIAAELNAIGLRCTAEQVLVLSGSQQGIDLVAKLFIDPGTTVAVEEPTYLAALQVFRFFGARLAPLRPRQALAGLDAEAPPALAYAIPSFQNPTGHCYDAAERDALARACEILGVPLFEDDPYRDLAYDACERTPVCARLEHAPWIYQGSFSKTLAPGLRLGYLVASPDLMPLLVRLKQAADLHSNRVSQHVVLAQLRSPDRAERMRRVVDAYRLKRDFFAAALQRHFGDLARWQTPPADCSSGSTCWPRSIPAHCCPRRSSAAWPSCRASSSSLATCRPTAPCGSTSAMRTGWESSGGSPCSPSWSGAGSSTRWPTWRKPELRRYAAGAKAEGRLRAERGASPTRAWPG